jgi:hypothetical protein
LITENNKELIATTKFWLSINFEMKDMGEASYVLDIKIIMTNLKGFWVCPNRLTLKKRS